MYSSVSPSASRPFVITRYFADKHGKLVPIIPKAGPCQGRDGRACDIRIHGQRERITGPKFTLTVVRCLVHGCAFTLYPFTHVPYGRSAVAPTDSSGQVVRAEDPRDAWRTTLFKSGVDADEGHAGERGHTNQERQRDIDRKHTGKPQIVPEAKEDPGTGFWSTQERTLGKLLRILGLAPRLSNEVRQWFATILVVPTLKLIEGARRIASDPGYVARGRAVLFVLSLMQPQIEQAARRLLIAGWQAGVWGRPLVWDPTLGVLRDLTHGLAPCPP